MNNIALNLPDEILLQIFSHFSVASQLDDFVPLIASHIALEDEQRTIVESAEVKGTLRLVSRRFSSLISPLAFEVLSTKSVAGLRNLASALRTEDGGYGVASLIRQATKSIRIHVSCFDAAIVDIRTQSKPTTAPTAFTLEKLLDDILTIFRSCGALTSLNCALPRDMLHLDSRPFEKALTVFAPSLRVLRLQCPMSLDLSLFLPRFTELRVWDFSAECTLAVKEDKDASYDFPEVHTIFGPHHVLYPALVRSRFPSLRRMIIQYIPQIEVSAFLQFLAEYGHQLRSLELLCTISQGQDVLALCPNLADLVIHYDYFEILPLKLPKLETIGIIGIAAPNCSTLQMILYVFEFLEYAFDNGRFPKLRKVRILEMDVVKDILKIPNAFKLHDRRFRSRMVDLEDAHGRRLAIPN